MKKTFSARGVTHFVIAMALCCFWLWRVADEGQPEVSYAFVGTFALSMLMVIAVLLIAGRNKNEANHNGDGQGSSNQPA